MVYFQLAILKVQKKRRKSLKQQKQNHRKIKLKSLKLIKKQPMMIHLVLFINLELKIFVMKHQQSMGLILRYI